MLESWEESLVTNPGPNVAGQGYPTAGVNVVAGRQVLILCHSFNYASAIFFSCSQQGFIDFDITPIVENWVNGDTDYGVMLRATDETISGQSPQFVTDEGPVDDRPYLIVNC